MINISKTWCPLPWIHLATRPNGDVRVCCTANASGSNSAADTKEIGLVKNNNKTLNLSTSTIEEIWNSDFMKDVRLQMLRGEKPPSCNKCFNEESNGISSKRNWETEVWKQRLDLDNIVSLTSDDGILPVSIPYFDLRLGNACQLKCIMCSPHDSSSWVKDWKQQRSQYTDPLLKNDQGWDIDYDYSWFKKNSFIESMKSQGSVIRELYFAGGEPLMIDEHYKILEFMVDMGFSKDCILRYNSNGLVFRSKLFNLWEKFKEVKFNFSIDSIGIRNNYIRYPSKWDNVVSNLKIFDDSSENVTINIACAVQALNVTSITDLAKWKLDQDFKKINKAPYGAGVIGLHLVYLPSYLNVRVLPNEIKELAAKKIDDFCDYMKDDKEFNLNKYGRQRWQGIVKYMFEEDWHSKLPALKQYLRVCDKTRNTQAAEIFTELGEMLSVR